MPPCYEKTCSRYKHGQNKLNGYNQIKTRMSVHKLSELKGSCLAEVSVNSS